MAEKQRVKSSNQLQSKLASVILQNLSQVRKRSKGKIISQVHVGFQIMAKSLGKEDKVLAIPVNLFLSLPSPDFL